jgi:hypothetical protein
MKGSGSASLDNKPSPTNDSNGAAAGSTTASTDKATVKSKKKQIARNDTRCDESSNPGRAVPKDCLTKSDTGAAATNSTQVQSGGSSQ